MKVYGYNGCPFCGKVRAFLNYYGFEYEDVEVNPITKAGSNKKSLKRVVGLRRSWRNMLVGNLIKAQVKAAVPGYGKVPVVEVITADGESVFIKDSAVIISGGFSK